MWETIGPFVTFAGLAAFWWLLMSRAMKGGG